MIHSLSLMIYMILLVGFLLQNNLRKDQFFNKIFLLTDTYIEVILEMPFFLLSNANIGL